MSQVFLFRASFRRHYFTHHLYVVGEEANKNCMKVKKEIMKEARKAKEECPFRAKRPRYSEPCQPRSYALNYLGTVTGLKLCQEVRSSSEVKSPLTSLGCVATIAGILATLPESVISILFLLILSRASEFFAMSWFIENTFSLLTTVFSCKGSRRASNWNPQSRYFHPVQFMSIQAQPFPYAVIVKAISTYINDTLL